jgi:hypothetical protein
MELIEAFLDHFAPLFNPDNVEPSPIGRALPVQASFTTGRSARLSTS